MKNIYLFGNGNTSFDIFLDKYKPVIDKALNNKLNFLVCDFKGIDTLIMEYLKDKTSDVTIYHCFEKPRYLPDKFKTKVSEWHIKSGFFNDTDRDIYVINNCDYYFAIDFNSDNKRKSGTQKNIELLQSMNKCFYT